MITFNKLNRLPTINDTNGFYAVYNSTDANGIYIVTNTKVITICQPEKWKLNLVHTTVGHPRFNTGNITTNYFNLDWLPTVRRLASGGVDGIGNTDYPGWNIIVNYLGKSINGITTSVMFACGLPEGSLTVSIQTPAEPYYYNEGRAVILCRPTTTIENNYIDGTILFNIYTDYEGNPYDGVKLGTRIWLQRVLKTTHYANGDSIPSTLNSSDWSTTTSGATYFYNDTLTGLITDTDKINAYGRCYNHYTLYDPRSLVVNNSLGWTIPYDTDFNLLISYLKTTYNIASNDDLRLKLLSTRQLNNSYNSNVISPIKTNFISSTIIYSPTK